MNNKPEQKPGLRQRIVDAAKKGAGEVYDAFTDLGAGFLPGKGDNFPSELRGRQSGKIKVTTRGEESK